jgi:hypothetical protein
MVTLAQDEVRGYIAGLPRRQQSRRIRPEFLEQVAELGPLVGVQERIDHIAGL